jgi:hypothetical protein
MRLNEIVDLTIQVTAAWDPLRHSLLELVVKRREN